MTAAAPGAEDRRAGEAQRGLSPTSRGAGRLRTAAHGRCRVRPRVRSCTGGRASDPGGLESAVEQVGKAYDAVADRWAEDRVGGAFRERRFVERLVASLPVGGHILDVGCGAGVPIGVFLREAGCEITGIDVSQRLLERARRAVPGGTFVLGDMRTVSVPGPFDAIVAWDAVFHLPRADHEAVFARFAAWLRPGGRLLLSLGGSADPGFTSEMYGVTFPYSGHEPATARALLERAGFRIDHWEIDDPSSRGHITVLASRAA